MTTKRKPKKTIIPAVDPKVQIEKYFASRSPIGEQDILSVLFFLYCIKKNIPLKLDRIKVTLPADSNDTLHKRIYSVITGGNADHEFINYMVSFYEEMKTCPKAAFMTEYPNLIRIVVMRYAGIQNSVLFPPAPVLATVSNILKDYGCKSVYSLNDNLGALSLFLEDDVQFYGHHNSEYLNIIRDVLYDTFNCSNDILPHTSSPGRYDAIVSLGGFDYYFAQGWEKYTFRLEYKCNLHAGALRAIMNFNKSDIVVFHAHHRLANNPEHMEIRKRLCEEGVLDMVITLPDNIYEDAKVATSILVINRKKTDDVVTFIAAKNAFKEYGDLSKDIDLRRAVLEEDMVKVSYEEMKDMEWAFNAYLYIQDAVCQEGQELVPLKDLVTFKAGYGQEPISSEVIDVDSCSANIADAIGDIRLQEAGFEDHYYKIDGPAVCFNVAKDFSLSVAVYDSPQPCSVYMSCYSLSPDIAKISLQYLAYTLLSDASFQRFIRHTLEYYADVDGIRPQYILNRKVAIYTDTTKQREAILPFLKEETAANRYNVILALSEKRSMDSEIVSLLSENNIKVLATPTCVPELSRQLDKYASDSVSSSERVDAVIVDTDIPYSNTEEDGFKDVAYMVPRYKIPFYASSAVGCDELDVPRRMMAYFTDEEYKRFYGTEAVQFSLLLKNLTKELQARQSHDYILRNKYPEFYTASTWIDERHPELNIGKHVSESLKQEIINDPNSRENSLNHIRIIAEHLIKWMQEYNLAPPMLKAGEVTKFYRDGRYNDYLLLDKNLIPKPLASLLSALYDVGNEGSHKFLNANLYHKSIVMILMSFVQWMYENSNLFDKKNEGCYTCLSNAEKKPVEGVVQCDTSTGKPYYYCGNIHLEVNHSKKLSEGDKVRVNDYKEELRPRKDLNIVFYSTKWTKID